MLILMQKLKKNNSLYINFEQMDNNYGNKQNNSNFISRI